MTGMLVDFDTVAAQGFPFTKYHPAPAATMATLVNSTAQRFPFGRITFLP
jgi:hypothetical protein